jgi:hypothetical protein
LFCQIGSEWKTQGKESASSWFELGLYLTEVLEIRQLDFKYMDEGGKLVVEDRRWKGLDDSLDEAWR